MSGFLVNYQCAFCNLLFFFILNYSKEVTKLLLVMQVKWKVITDTELTSLLMSPSNYELATQLPIRRTGRFPVSVSWQGWSGQMQT